MKVLIVLFSCLCATSALADVHYGQGKIVDIVVGFDVPGRAVIYIEGFSEAGSCPKYGAKNLVISSLPENGDANFILSSALMAFAASKEVKIRISDSNRDANGWCQITGFRLNKEF